MTKLTKSFKKNERQTQNKTIFSSEHGFTINTDNVTYIENLDATYHSYTFPITREIENDSIENLILSLKSDGTYESIIMLYKTNAEEKAQIINGETVDLAGKVTVDFLNDDSLVTAIFNKATAISPCVTMHEPDTTPCLGGYSYQHDDGYNSYIGENCGGFNTFFYIDIDYACIDGMTVSGHPGTSPQTNNNGDSNHNTTTNNGGSDNNTTTNNGTVVTTPIGSQSATNVIIEENSCATEGEVDNLLIKLGLSSNNNLKNCFMEPEMCASVRSLNNYIFSQTPRTPEYPSALNFSKTAAEAICNDGEVDFEEKIIYTIDGECQKTLLKDLMALSSPFTTMIKNVFGQTDNVNVKFWNGNNNPASTNPYYQGNSTNYTINIKFDSSYLNTATDLSILAVTLHELSHAYFISQYLSGNLTSPTTNYGDLHASFIAFYEESTQDTFDTNDNEIHNAMNDFINEMASTIYNYAQENNIVNVNIDYCKSLVLGTMQGTSLFDTMLTIPQQMNSQNIVITEQNNNEYDPTYPIKGTPCN